MDIISGDIASQGALVALALTFAIASGFRVLIPLFIASVLSVIGLVTLRSGYEWLTSSSTMVVLGLAVAIELLAYAVPVVDNAFDAVAVPATLIVGTLSALILIPDTVNAPLAGLVALTGGGTAAGLGVGLAKVRLLSTTTTGGIGNLPLSLLEAGAAIGLPLLAVVFLGVAVTVLAVVLLGLAMIWRLAAFAPR